ncbi:MAG: acetate/propionate family kinase [Thermoplasmata archaeon]
MRRSTQPSGPRWTPAASPIVAAINIGSSSIKFALFRRSTGTPLVEQIASAKVEHIGSSDGSITIRDDAGRAGVRSRLRTNDLSSAMVELFSWIESSKYHDRIGAIGHRIVTGGLRFSAPQPVTPALLRAIRHLAPLDPDHLPAELQGIRMVQRRIPHAFQVVCFDTAFHRTMPRVAQLYALPRRMATEGLIRYGFHGLSCEYIVGALTALDARRILPSRLIVAHLGNGCSMTAIRNGRSVETTMGFTPTGGLVMSTRPGDLDPEVVVYLAEHLRQTPTRLSHFLNRNAGLLGISGTSGDMRTLQRRAPRDRRAREAVDLFCYHAGKALGSLTAALGGLDALVFTGGIGENDAVVRERISAFGHHLGIRIDPRRNAVGRAVISTKASAVSVRVIPTNEERVIAAHTLRLWSHRTR